MIGRINNHKGITILTVLFALFCIVFLCLSYVKATLGSNPVLILVPHPDYSSGGTEFGRATFNRIKTKFGNYLSVRGIYIDQIHKKKGVYYEKPGAAEEHWKAYFFKGSQMDEIDCDTVRAKLITWKNKSWSWYNASTGTTVEETSTLIKGECGDVFGYLQTKGYVQHQSGE